MLKYFSCYYVSVYEFIFVNSTSLMCPGFISMREVLLISMAMNITLAKIIAIAIRDSLSFW